MLVFGRVLLFWRPGLVKEDVLVEEAETSTRREVGKVKLEGTPFGVGVRTSTRV